MQGQPQVESNESDFVAPESVVHGMGTQVEASCLSSTGQGTLNGPAVNSTSGVATGVPEVHVAAATTDDMQLIQRLRAENASPAEWRREALAHYTEGRVNECGRILEAALGDETRAANSSIHPGGVDNMYLLAEFYLSQIICWQRPPLADMGVLLRKASTWLERAETFDLEHGVTSGVEAFVAKGFHAITQHVMRYSPEGDELKRAEFVFDAALKLDSSSPRALLGKAIVLTQHKEWAKALGHFRQVLKRAAPPAPRTGLRLESLKHLRFAIAACFCDLGRFEQMRNALGGVVSADPHDVESLCALAHLEAKVSKDGVGKSLDYLDEAVKADQNHPVVLCQLANHAFYCGLEQQPNGQNEENDGELSPWALAKDLLQKALASTVSQQVKAEVHYQMGRLEHAQGQYARACKEYQKCREIQPEHFACVYGLAQTCVHQHRFSEAIIELEAMRRGKNDLPEVLKLLTFAYLMCGDRANEAVKCADALVAKDRDDMEAWAMRAEAHDQLSSQHPTVTAPKVGIEAYEQMARLLEDGNGIKRGCASPQMWNNLGTLRGLQGDPDGAKEAYSRGLELAERRLVGEDGGPSSAEEAKDLLIARLTMRFNRAWLAENEGDKPNYMQATQDYMALNEEHNWYADSLLQLGAQWQRMGEVDIAVQRYQEAMKQNPVLATLMQAELYRHQTEYAKALQSAEMAVQCAGEKQFHYAHVYLGNLYFEVASAAATKPRDRDAYMHKALRNFTKALEHKKDSHYAANGIGMVFARRGKLDFARRTFQSVMQHHAMAGDPSVFINLGHTYLLSGGDNARKAIALYERAKRLRPNDLGIRLYLAKAHFRLKEFDRCTGVLGDATQIWPDDLLLRFNLAISLESFGVHLVSEERKTKRVVGMDNGMNQMNHAVQLLSSAARLFEYVYAQWVGMSDEERKRFVEARSASDELIDEMLSASAHKLYCADIQGKAQEELIQLQAKRADIERRMQENAGFEEEEQRRQQEQKENEKLSNQEHLDEDNDRAKDLEEKAKRIDLGKNLEQRVDKKVPKQKEPKENNIMRSRPQANDGPDVTGGNIGKEQGESLDPSISQVAPLEADEPRGRRDKKKKREKRGKKEKDGKKDKKKHKKGKKRGVDEEESLEEGQDEEDSPAGSDQDADDFGKVVNEEDGDMSTDRKLKKHKKDKKKHNKKHKKDKKTKRARREDSDDEADDDAGGAVMEDDLFGQALDENDNAAMEEELFGPDTDA